MTANASLHVDRSGDWHGVDLVVADGGATGCRLAAYGPRGERLAAVTVGGHASLTLGEAVAWDHLSTGIASLAAALDMPEAVSELPNYPARLVFGLAGALQERRREAFLTRVRAATGVTSRCHLVTDGEAQLVGASGGTAAACLALGTGSVLHWQDRNGVHGMAGGWGFPAGDEGSGAWLGVKVLQCYLWQRDGEPVASTLLDALAAVIGTSVSDIQRWSVEGRSSRLATLAPLVITHAQAGDALAMRLMREGANCCEHLVSLAPDDVPLYVAGGLADAYRPYLEATLGSRLRTPVGDALDGLQHIGRAVFSR